MKITGTGSDGKPIEVDVPDGTFVPSDALARDYIPRAAHDQEFARLRSQSQGLKNPEELLRDQEFRAKALETWGVKQREPTKDEQERIAAIRKELEEAEVTPLRSRLEESDTRVRRLLDRRLESELVQAALGAGVKPSLLTRRDGQPAAITAFFDGSLAYDEESDEFYAFDPRQERFVISAEAGRNGGSTYKGIREVVTEWAKRPENVDFLHTQRQTGPGFSGTPGGGNGGSKVIDGRDARAFGANLEAIAKGDVKVNVPGVESGA